jgi:amino acid adenylation domain-containing protein
MTLNRTMHDWFAASVAEHGAETALQVAGETYTYTELDRIAAHLAARVVEVDGTVPAAVGLYASRSLVGYAGYLAVQRLGAAVVPLNPAWPKLRNDTVIASAGIGVVLSESASLDVSAKVLHPDKETLASYRDTPAPALPQPRPRPDGVAYILFTSGSTGTPKGVPVGHANVSAFLGHVIPRYALGPGSRVSQMFDLTFDLSVFDLFASWGSGATLVAPAKPDLLNAAKFAARERITHWFSVPSVVSVAVQLGRLAPGCLPDLKWGLFCGEALTIDQADAWQAAAPYATIENLYGPTELTLAITQLRLPADRSAWPSPANGTVPIGTVYPGHETLLVGEDGRPAQIGELCVRGPQRFAGYLSKADNTDRFYAFDGEVATPCGEVDTVEESLWYRTGDLVTTEDGQLVHMGRIDHQVKVHGYRVELGEIEAAMRAQDGILQAVVVLVRTDGREQLEAAYTGEPVDTDALTAALRARLPVHMVPRAFTLLEEMPLNMNGKIDRSVITKQLEKAHQQ